MIDLGVFSFAAPPRCATTWIIKAAVCCGLPEGFKASIHQPHQMRADRVLKVTTVRHPCDWLLSYWMVVHPGKIGVPVVDRFADLPLEFDDFIRLYLKRWPGGVGKMFFGYHADNYIRLEDLPFAFHELLVSCGCSDPDQCLNIMKMRNVSNKQTYPKWAPSLYDQVLQSEGEMIERFEYEWDSSHYSGPTW